jgi:hypothetical protein
MRKLILLRLLLRLRLRLRLLPPPCLLFLPLRVPRAQARTVLRSSAVVRKLLMMIFREEHPLEETGGGSGGSYRRLHAGRCIAAMGADEVPALRV